MDVKQTARDLKSKIRILEEDIKEILQSGNYYCTEEIAREFTEIKNSIEHLKLDSTFLTSDEWQNQACNVEDDLEGKSKIFLLFI